MAEITSRMIELCPFRFNADRGEYLLIRRAPGEPLYPLLWQFVTGRVEEGERAPHAALRELKEETGAAPLRFWVVPGVNSFYDPASDSVNLVTLFAAQIGPTADIRLSAEHSAYEWLPHGEARKRLVWPAQRSCLDIVHQYILGGEKAGVLLEIPM